MGKRKEFSLLPKMPSNESQIFSISGSNSAGREHAAIEILQLGRLFGITIVLARPNY